MNFNPSRFVGQVAIVTGASRGIGAAIVTRLVQEGASVLACDILDDAGTSLCSQLDDGNGRVAYKHLDVSEEAAWPKVIDACIDMHGTPTILINNAGITSTAGIVDETLSYWHKVLSVNLTGTFFGMRAVIPLFIKQGSGAIVNLSSIWGTLGASGAAAYQASKGGVTLLTKNAAVTYGEYGIRVNSVHPGGVETEMLEASGARASLIPRTPLVRMGDPMEIAAAVAFLASGEASYITGDSLMVDGGFSAI